MSHLATGLAAIYYALQIYLAMRKIVASRQ
jgi:hypothetical protein